MEFAEFGISPTDEWAAFGLVRVFDVDYVRIRKPKPVGRTHIPIGWVVVKNPHGVRVTHKLPGGSKEATDKDPLKTFFRELWEEAHIVGNPRHTQYLGKEWMPESALGGAHWRIFFQTDIGRRKLARMNGDHPRSNGDKPEFTGLREFGYLVASRKFMPSHYKNLVKFGAILKFNGA
ncbi:MAG: NUDIX domain-containing protein [bacterium]|nr:NUDIX domain-containing protein [bacterium]